MIKVLLYQKENSNGNPYLYEIERILKAQGVQTERASLPFWNKEGNYDIINLQWPEELFNWIEKNHIINLEDIRNSIRERFKKREDFVASVTKPKRPPIKLINTPQFCGICLHYKVQESYTNPNSQIRRCSLHEGWIVDAPFLGCCDAFKLDKKELETLQMYKKR